MTGLRVGAASININPPMGARKIGFRLFGDPIASIDDDIELGIIVLESKGVMSAVIGCDLCLTTTQEANEFRDTVAEILKIDRDKVLLNLSHNHSAGALRGHSGNPSSEEELAVVRADQKITLAEWKSDRERGITMTYQGKVDE